MRLYFDLYSTKTKAGKVPFECLLPEKINLSEGITLTYCFAGQFSNRLGAALEEGRVTVPMKRPL